MNQQLQKQFRIGLLTGASAIPRQESPSEHLYYSFVDVLELKTGGAALETRLDLVPGECLDFMFFDIPEKTWRMHYCRITRFDPDQQGVHVCEVEFLEHPGPENGEESDLRFLMNTKLLQYLPQNVFLQLINCLTREEFAENTVMQEQGRDAGCLYIIQQGRVALEVRDNEGVHRIGELDSGDVLGEGALLTGEPNLHTAIASCDCVVWGLDKKRFLKLLEQYPDLRIFMTELVTKHFESSTFLAERRIGKFVVKEQMGSGAWGLVYRGEHSILGFPAAVKMLKHSMALEESFAESFRNEAKLIAALSHQNIVQVYDIEETYQTLFIVMEMLEGQSLQHLLKRRGKLPYEQTVLILSQVLAALDYAHQHGVVHRDIKPDNVFLLPADQVKVLDFGLACPFDTEDDNMAGTVYYAPPEQIEGEPVGPAADIYSTGIIAYEMIVGKRPYPEDDLLDLMDSHCHEDIPDPKIDLPDIPERLREFILKACQRDPSDRYTTATAALKALGRVSEEQEPRKVTVLTLACKESRAHDLARLVEEFSDKATQMGVSMKMMTLEDI